MGASRNGGSQSLGTGYTKDDPDANGKYPSHGSWSKFLCVDIEIMMRLKKGREQKTMSGVPLKKRPAVGEIEIGIAKESSMPYIYEFHI